MIAISIVDDGKPIATVELEPDLNDEGEDTGQFAPLIEFRVLRYALLPAYDVVRPVLHAGGEATMLIGSSGTTLSDADRSQAKQAMKAAEAIEARLRVADSSGEPMVGRVTMFREVRFSGHALHSIGIALDAQYVKASSSAQPNER